MEIEKKFIVSRSRRIKVSGMCPGCGGYHAGDMMVRITKEPTGRIVFDIGTEGEGDDTFHVMTSMEIKSIPGSSVLNMMTVPEMIQ